MQIKFPPSFLWGAAISSYQCEGGNLYSDWHLWEKEKGLEQAGMACDHYHLFKQDFQLAAKLNLNALRFSLEWARIAPQPNTFLEQELAHYQQVIDSLIKLNLKPVVTLHHFTNPIWFAKNGGWRTAKNIDSFLNYLQKTAETFKHRVEYWLIFNEPLVYVYNSFVCGIWPPGVKSFPDAKKVLNNIVAAYIAGYKEIKNIYKNSTISPKISLAKNLRIFSPCPNFNFGLNSLSARLRDRVFNLSMLDYLTKKECLDFLGINYYCKEYTRFKWLYGRECGHKMHGERKNHLGWYIASRGFYDVLLRLKRFNLPVLITENGTAEKEGRLYEEYLISHLESVGRAILEGIDIRGYMWWSLLDNFEWDKGFKYRFGLADVDYKTLTRKIRPFAFTYSKICKENQLSVNGY